MSQTKVKSGLIDFTEGIDSFIEFSGGNSTVTGNLTVTGTLVGYTPTTSLNISNWNTAYSYSQVGHLPLTGGTLTGQLTTSDTGTSSSIVITSDSIGNGAIDLTKNTNGTGIRITNNGVGSGIVTFNNSTGTGITIANTSTGKGLLIDNSSSTTGDPFVYTLGGAAYVKAKINYLGNLTLAGTITASGYNNSNWDTAYGWGNHASVGYLTSFDITTQTDAKYLRSDESDTMSGSLTVSGVITTSTNEGKLVINSTAANGKQYQFISIDTGNLGIYDGTAYRLWVGGNGNVGIGTTSPSRKLHIKSDDDTRGILIEQTQASSYAELHLTANRQFRIGTGGSTSDSEAQDRFYVYDATAAAHRFTIDSSGFVGIGTTSPSYKLDVNSGIMGASFTSGAGGYTSVRFTSVGGGAVGSLTTYLNKIYIGSENPGGTGSNAEILIEPNAGNILYLKQGGNVGIGTTSPTNTLTVQSNSTQLRLQTASDPSGYYSFIESNYNAANPLNIYSSAAASYAMGTISLSGITGVNTYLNSYYGIIFGTSNSLISAATVRMMITNSGNVGIGTTSPERKLSVQGSVRIDRSTYGWWSSGNNSWDGSAYLHLKTNLYGGSAGNTEYTMSLFYGRYYSYSGEIREGHLGFHNWSGAFYSTTTTGSFWSGPYMSSDGYVVLIVNLNYGNHHGITIDWHQAFPYPLRTSIVTSVSASSGTAAVY